MTTYVESIDEIYSMADCYIFPVSINHGAIEIPLSIIEAMSCNLPILTTRFGGVPDIFNEKDGLFYVESNEEMVKCLRNVLKPNFQVNTRKHVLPYSWENIGFKLNQDSHELSFYINNFLNTEYIPHTSLLKEVTINEPGRSFVIKYSINF